MADCQKTLLTSEERQPDRVEKAAAAIVANLARLEAVPSQLEARTKDLAKITEPITDLYKVQSMAAARQAAVKDGVPNIFVDWAVRKHYLESFPTTDRAAKELKIAPLGQSLCDAGYGTSRATVDRWLRILRKALEKHGQIIARGKGPPLKPVPDLNAENACNPNSPHDPHLSHEDDVGLETEGPTGLTDRDTRSRELYDPQDEG